MFSRGRNTLRPTRLSPQHLRIVEATIKARDQNGIGPTHPSCYGFRSAGKDIRETPDEFPAPHYSTQCSKRSIQAQDKMIPPGTEPRDALGSPDRFGFEWNRYPDLVPEYEEQFKRWTALLSADDWRGRSFLDVGCGGGRNSYWACRYGSSGGLAIDLDDRTLEAARRALAEWPAVEVRKASAYDIGERDRFDIVFSIGVLHHLERPEQALAEMMAAAKPGGKVLIWVYGAENNEWIKNFVDPVRNRVLSRMPVSSVHWLSLMPTMLLWLGLRLGWSRTAYLRQIRRFRFSHLRSIVFDQMLPKISHYWTEAEVRSLMTQARLVEIDTAWVNEVSWCAVGRKPAHTER